MADEETIAEDQEAIRTAKAQEKLEVVAGAPEKIHETLEDALGNAPAADSWQVALAMDQALSRMSEVPSADTASELEEPSATIEAATANAVESETNGIELIKDEALRGLLAHYLEFIETTSAKDDKRPRFSTRV